MRNLFILMLITLFPALGHAQLPPGKAVVPPLDRFQLAGSEIELGSMEPVAVKGQSFDRALSLSTRDGSGADWSVQLQSPTTAAVAEGDVLLAKFWLRCTESMTGEGFTALVFEQNGPPHDKSAEMRVGAGPEWVECFVRFTARASFAPGTAMVCLRMGYDRQTIEVGGFELVNFGKGVKLADLPRSAMTYQGRSADAPWRKAAAERIEKIRKGDLKIKVVDAAGGPVEGAQVDIKQINHAFAFGSCVTVQNILGTTDDDARCREIIEKYFNRVVFENDMKWPSMWDGAPPELDRAVAWLLQRNIEIRGHNLQWPSWRWSPQKLRALEKDASALREKCADRVTSAVAHFRGKLIHWDVVNEPYNNRDLFDILGEDVMVDWFRLARAADPDCKLFINDFGIFDGGAGNEHRKHYFNTIQSLLSKGTPVDGIGIQSHFGANLPPPSQLVAVLDQFSSFGLPIESTEISINLEDRELQADYLRDYMTAAFSHPNVSGLMLWGFWEGRHWRPDAALWTKDWQLRPHGKMWIDLVSREWMTSAAVQSDATGAAAVRGFAGDYEIAVIANGKAVKQRVRIVAQKSNDVTIELK